MRFARSGPEPTRSRSLPQPKARARADRGLRQLGPKVTAAIFRPDSNVIAVVATDADAQRYFRGLQNIRAANCVSAAGRRHPAAVARQTITGSFNFRPPRSRRLPSSGRRLAADPQRGRPGLSRMRCAKHFGQSTAEDSSGGWQGHYLSYGRRGHGLMPILGRFMAVPRGPKPPRTPRPTAAKLADCTKQRRSRGAVASALSF